MTYVLPRETDDLETGQNSPRSTSAEHPSPGTVKLAPSLEYPTVRTDVAVGVKTWTVGTLTYTAGGLALLFFWLLLGDFALNLRDRSVGPVVQLFLKREGASDTAPRLLTRP